MDYDDEYVDETLKTLTNEDILSIMTIGEESISKLKHQKIVFLASEILKIDTADDYVAYDYGMYNEVLMEEVEDMTEIINKGNKLSLTDFGVVIYNRLRDKLNKKMVELFDILRSLNEDNLLKITYYLYPELTTNSKIKDRVLKEEPSAAYNLLSLVSNSMEKSKYNIKRNGDSIEITKVDWNEQRLSG